MALQFLYDGYFAGKVGIGVESPTRTLQVNSGGTNIVATFESSDTLSRISFVDSNTSSDAVVQIGADGNELVLFAGGAEHVRVDSAGNVGIGTISPGGKLDVAYPGTGGTGTFGIGEGINITSLSPNITFNDTSASVDNYAIHLNQSVFTLGRYTSATSQSPDLVLKAGNVGIGTASPDFKLDVDGTFGVSDLPFNSTSVSVLVADEITGVEEVTNGSFTTDANWNKNPNWTISGGTANADGTSNQDMNQIPVNGYPVVGEVFRVSFEITARTQGQVRIAIGGGATDFLSAVGKYEYIHTAVNTDRIRIQCQNSFIGSVDNLSIKQITSASNQIQKREISSGAFGDELWAITPTDSNNIYNLNSGNVGIGTDNPGTALQVGDGTADDTIRTVFSDGSYTDVHGYGLYMSRTDSYIRPVTDETQTLRIGDDGKTWNTIIHNANLHTFNNDASEWMRIDSTGNVGIGDNTPTARLFVSDTTSSNTSTVQINHTRDDADKATRAIGIDMNLSGADTTTADRTNYGLFIDIDSSANGDASNEHRIYGVSSTINFEGYTDIARGGFFNAESNYTGGKTAQLVGVYGQATHDVNDAAGGVSNMYGVYGLSTIQDLGDVDNAFGGYFQVSVSDARGAANVGVIKAVEGEIVIDKSTAIDYGTMIGISSIIDNNEGAVPNFGNQFLFKGDYQGDKGSDAYGIYCEGDKHYLEGKLAINLTTPTQVLHVAGNARVTGAYYDSNNSPGTANQVLISTVTGTDWVDGSGSSIIGGPYLPLAGGTMTGTGSIVMPDGFKLQLGNGIFSIFNDGTYSIIRSANEPLLIDSNGITFRGYAPYDTLATITSSGISIKSALLSNQENTDVDTGAEVVAQVAVATYTAAFFDFVIKKTTNVRSGTVYACHDGTNVEFTETSTQDLGDTSDVTLSVDISGGNMRLLATVTSDDWSVKSLIRAI